MGAGLRKLVAYGAQDIYLTGNPQITFFKVVYRRHTNFSMESIQQTWNGTQAPGARLTATISRNGDLVHKCYVEISGSGTIKQTCCNPGAAIVEQVECEIGGQLIDRQYGHWMETWSELTVPGLSDLHVGGWSHNSSSGTGVQVNGRCFRKYNGATVHGNNFQTTTGMGGIFSSSGTEEAGNAGLDNKVAPHGYTVPLYFWFCRNPGLALPLIALQYHEVKINMTTGPAEAIDIDKNELWADYIYLDTDERRRFAQVSHEYLIEQIQTDTIKGTNLKLNFNHPVKELIWTCKDVSASATTLEATPRVVGNASTTTWKLVLNGHDRFAEKPTEYFAGYQVAKYHKGTPLYLDIDQGGATAGHHCAINTIAVYSFALKPEEHQPSGTCNFSRIDSAQLINKNYHDDTDNTFRIYAVNYNILRIMSGMGGLAYSN